MALQDIYKVRVVCTLQEQTAYNVSHWRITAVAGAGLTDQVIADKFALHFQATLIALMTNAARYWGVGAQKVQPAPVGNEFFNGNRNVAGTAGAGIEAKQVAGYFNLKTAFAGRSQIGKKYIPFVDSNDTDINTGAPTAGFMVRLGAHAAQYSNAVTFPSGADSLTFTPVVYHRTGGTADSIVTATAKQKWATQRRRGDFGRKNPPPF